MPLSVTAAGVPPLQSIWSVPGVWNRLAGLGLTLIALGPVLVIAAAITLTAFTVVDLARHAAAGIETVAGIVESKITPQIAKVESALDSLGAPLSRFKDSVEGAMTAFERLGDVQIAKGAWGTTPSVHVTLPPSDVHIGEVTIEVPDGIGLDGVHMKKETTSLGTIGAGSLFNEATPSVAIPPAPIVLPMEPLHQALEPLGPNGPVGKAIKSAEDGLTGAFADIGNLRKPILKVRDGIAGLLAPLEKAIAPILSALFVVLIALVAQALLCVFGILYLIRTRPMEFANALLMGPFGLLGYCYRALLQLGVSLLSGRQQVRPERLIDDLRAQAERLQSEIASLRAEFLPPRAAAQ